MTAKIVEFYFTTKAIEDHEYLKKRYKIDSDNLILLDIQKKQL